MEEITVNGKGSVILWPKKERILVCLGKEDMKRLEKTEDCFILDFDPYDSFDFSMFSSDDKNQGDVSEDVCIIGENSQVKYPTKPATHVKILLQYNIICLTLLQLLSMHGLCFGLEGK